MVRLFLAAIAALALSQPASAQRQFRSGDYADYQPDLANGAVMFNAGGCAACHAVDGDDAILAGGREFRTSLATYVAPNITSHPSAGIGGWSRADFLNALLNGRAPDGHRYYGVVFPFPAFSRMRPEDALDLQAYLATLPQSDVVPASHRVTLLADVLLMRFSDVRDPLPSIADPQLQRGAYLVEALGHCGECHSRREEPGLANFSIALDPAGAFVGEATMFGELAGAINRERLTLTGTTPEAFVNGSLVQAMRLDGYPMTSAMMRRVSRSTARLSHEDRVAIYAYLVGAPVDPGSVQRVASQSPGTIASPSVTRPILASTPGAGAIGLVERIASMCAAEAQAEPAILPATAQPAADPALAATADAVIETHCRECHGRNQRNARSFLTGSLAELARDPRALTPGDHRASLLWETIARDRMPTSDRPRLRPQELQALANWIDSLSPPQSAPQANSVQPQIRSPIDLPRYLGGTFENLTQAAFRDLHRVDPLDRLYQRYFSFANIPLPENLCAEDGTFLDPTVAMHAALNKFVNSVSRGTSLRQVDPVAFTDGALVRIDLRDMNWTAEDWESVTTGVFSQGSHEAGFSREDWDRLAIPYPYAIDPVSDPALRGLATETGASVPILHADWFARHASEAPYYDLLLRLPPNIRQLEQRLGVDAASQTLSGRTIRAGLIQGQSGVSDHNRVLERFDLAGSGYYWVSYDFSGDEGRQSIVDFPDGPNGPHPTVSGTLPFLHDGGEMIFSLPNGMQGFYLSEADGTRIFEGPTEIVSFRNSPAGQGISIINARSCFTCHYDGIISSSDSMHSLIQSSSGLLRQQRDLLLRLYPGQARLNEAYERDVATYLSALDALGAIGLTPAGRRTSLRPPTRGELVTWLAGHRFELLDADALARMFYLTPSELGERVNHLADPLLQSILRTWLNRTANQQPLRVAEVDLHWAAMLSDLTGLRPRVPSHAGTPPTQYQPVAEVVDLHIAPTRLRAGEMLTTSAIPPAGCAPLFFFIYPDRSFSPTSLEGYRAETVGPRTRFVADQTSPAQLVIEASDPPGHYRFGFMCGADHLNADDLRQVFRAIANSASLTGVSSPGNNSVPFYTTSFEVYR